MRNFTRKGFLLGVLFLAAHCTYAQPKAELIKLVCADGARVQKVSDNGQWLVGSYVDDAGNGVNAHLWDIRGEEVIDHLLSEEGEKCNALDVTDDGSIVVGSYDLMPAYYKNNEWIELPLPEGVLDGPLTGEVRSVTPDGKTMVGLVWGKKQSTSCACIWIDDELIIPELPERDITDDPVWLAKMNTIDDVSADGSIMLGFLNYNVLPGRTGFIYRNNTCEIIAKEELIYEDEYGILYKFLDQSCISPNGKYIAGIMHDIIPTGEYNPNEFDTSYIYDVENEKLNNLGEASSETGIFFMDNQGVGYAASPINFPIRTACIYLNEEYKDLNKIINDYFNLDILGETGFEQTGTITASADGKVIAGMATMGGYNYIVKLPCNLADYEKYAASVSSTALVKAEVNADGYVLNLIGEVANMIITDLSGKTVKQIQNPAATVNVPELPAGVYAVTLITPQGNQTISKVCIK